MKDIHEFYRKAGVKLVDLLGDLDQLLGTCEQFLLGRMLADAIAHGKTAADRQLFEFNARNQITLWGPHANVRYNQLCPVIASTKNSAYTCIMKLLH